MWGMAGDSSVSFSWNSLGLSRHPLVATLGKLLEGKKGGREERKESASAALEALWWDRALVEGGEGVKEFLPEIALGNLALHKIFRENGWGGDSSAALRRHFFTPPTPFSWTRMWNTSWNAAGKTARLMNKYLGSDPFSTLAFWDSLMAPVEPVEKIFGLTHQILLAVMKASLTVAAFFSALLLCVAHVLYVTPQPGYVMEDPTLGGFLVHVPYSAHLSSAWVAVFIIAVLTVAEGRAVQWCPPTRKAP